MSVRPLAPADAAACDAIVASLPDWFGDVDGLAACARAVRTQAGLVAEAEGRVVAFLTSVSHFPESDEITWLAVHASARGRGHGTALVEECARRSAAAGASLLLAKTLGPSDPSPEYAQTRAFWRARGFLPVEELHELWPGNPALLMVRSLAHA